MLGSRHWPTLSRGNKTALRELHLGECHIGDKGTKALAEALQRNRWLQVLGLAHNRIGDSGVTALAGALVQNVALASRTGCGPASQHHTAGPRLCGNAHIRNSSAILKALLSDWSGRLSCDRL